MNLYAVTLSCERHYGNGHMRRENEQPQKIVATDGEKAVLKAKKKVAFAKPILEGLTILEVGVETP